MSYTYDANGNMTHDGMRGVDLEYNSLNLIKKVSQGNTANATYRWLADGTKAGVTDNEGNGFEYLGSFVYQRDVAGLNLESTSFGAGRFVASSTGEMTPFYHITDHLGSVRAVFTAEFKDVSLGRGTVRRLTTELIAQNDYYAFGLRHENPNLAQHTSNRYLYNGKEEQTTGGVDLLDYGARTYDPKILRWTQVDPLAEKMQNFSPYAYTFNNPISYIDPDGRHPALIIAAKALVGGVVDAGIQMAFSMVGGQSFSEAWSDLDWTSVGAGAVVGALVAPGASTAAKLITTGAVIADASFDIRTDGRVEVVGDEKSALGAFVGIAAFGVPGNITDDAIGIASKSLATKGFRSFTAKNFRENLSRLTGKNPIDSQAHHIFPQEFRKLFNDAGLNIDDPIYGTWWNSTIHKKKASEYNATWKEFFRTDPSKDQILEKGRELMQEYGLSIYF